LRKSLTISTQRRRTEISLYEGGIIPDNKFVNNEMMRLRAAFKQLDEQYFVVLMERIKSKAMTCDQLHDAISKVIDSCIYPVPGMAEILSHDRKVQLYTHKMIVDTMIPKGYDFSDFEMIELDSKKYWIEK